MRCGLYLPALGGNGGVPDILHVRWAPPGASRVAPGRLAVVGIAQGRSARRQSPGPTPCKPGSLCDHSTACHG